MKTERFTGLNVDLERLAIRLQTYLQENGFEVAYTKDPTEPASWFFIQARKLGALRTMAGARRSTDIAIKGTPDNFDVSIGTGEWGKNILTSAPLFVVPIVGVSVTIAKLYVGKKFESNLWKFINDQVKFLSNSANKPMDFREYACDYVEGYPGLKNESGKMILMREKGGKNKIIFKGDSAEIKIPAENVINAELISKRKGLHEDDLMIRITYKDENGKIIKPIFNINDDVIRGTMAGIEELVGEDKILRNVENVRIVSDVKFCQSCGIQLPKEAKFCISCGKQQI